MPESYRLGDLNWARLTPWRQFVAHLWDAGTLQDSLRQIRSLDIHYVAPSDQQDSARALLMLGWISDALGWELIEAQTGPTGGFITRWRKEDWEGKAEILPSKLASV